MLDEWIGNFVGQLHCNKVTKTQIAQELGVTKEYVSAILNGHRAPSGIEKRLYDALNNILEKRGG